MNYEEANIVRIHQHINPLESKYLVVPPIPDWNEIYKNLNQPLLLDLGSAAGHFLIKMAKATSNWNFLGIEIRKPLVDRANRWRAEMGLTNLYFFFGQVQVVLRPVLESLPKNVLQYVTINFPDPWFKKRHKKRRMVNEELLKTIAEFLQPGGKVFVQTDVEELMLDMKSRFESVPDLVLSQDGMDSNPFGIPTEREISVQRLGRIVYRALYIKKDTNDHREVL